MNDIQEIIVLLWLVPVLGFIVLPLLWSIFGMLYRLVERSKLSDITGFVTLNNWDAATQGKAEKRSRPRINLKEGSACIDGECDCCKALVSNISKQGICLRNIPKKMYLESKAFKVVLRTRQKDYTVMARPVWKRMAGMGCMIGAKIDRVPDEWKSLVTSLCQSSAAEPV